jgi:hypothetical protein
VGPLQGPTAWGGIVHRATAPTRSGTVRRDAARCGAAMRYAHSRTRSRTRSRTHGLPKVRPGWRSQNPPPGCQKKTGSISPCAVAKNAASKRSPGAPRKIGQHFPLITKGNARSLAATPGKTPREKMGSISPCAEGEKSPCFRHSPGGHAAENSAAQYYSAATVDGVGVASWAPRAPNTQMTSGSAGRKKGGKAAPTDHETKS